MNNNYKQKAKVRQITIYQEKYGLSNHDMAKRIGISEERYEELIQDCTGITPEEIMKISLSLNLKPTNFLINLTGDNHYLIHFSVKKIDYYLKYGEDKVAQAIANEIMERGILIHENKFYRVGRSCRIHEEITREERKRLADICLRNHCINAARFLCNDENLFNITSLNQLDFLSEGEKKVFLYGDGYKGDFPMVSFPLYFDAIAESLSKDEQLQMYQNAKTILEIKLEISKELDKSIYKIMQEDIQNIKDTLVQINLKIKNIN